MLKRIFIAMILLITPCFAGSAYYTTVDSQAVLQSYNWSLLKAYGRWQTASFYAGGTTGSNKYQWVAGASCAASADGVTQVNGAGNSLPQTNGCLRLNVTSDVYLDNFGAHPDGTNATATTSAINAAYAAASVGKFSLRCRGTYSINGSITASAGVTLAGDVAGFITSGTSPGCEINADAVTSGDTFVLLNANSTATVEAPRFRDLFIHTKGAYGVRLNSISGGFTDGSDSQSYVFDAELQNVRIYGGSVAAFQCSKCFHVRIESSEFTGTGTYPMGHGIDLEGVDFPRIIKNRIVNGTSAQLLLNAQGTFGNHGVVDQNDLINAPGGYAYISSSQRSVSILNNAMENIAGTGTKPCLIEIDGSGTGGYSTVIHHNGVTDPSGTNWLCVVGNLAGITATDNWTTGPKPGPALFNSGSGSLFWWSNLYRQKIVHYGNFREDGFPFNTQGSPSTPLGVNVLLDITPDTQQNISNSVLSGNNITAVLSGEYVVPYSATAATAMYVNPPVMTAAQTVSGIISVCFKARSAVAGTKLNVLPIDAGSGRSDVDQALTTASTWYCPAALTSMAAFTSASFLFRNVDSVTPGTIYVSEIILKQG